jgi:hypothetical protein
MADQAWVVEKSIGILRTEPNIGATDLQKRLKDEYKVTTGYQTVWRAKEKAMDKLYGTWGESFQNLWNFKAEIEKRSPGSIVEVDVKSEGGKVYFCRFFMALRPCIDGFLNGCRPYVSIDSTFMNGKWNGQLASIESFNSWIRGMKDLPPDELADSVREKIMKLFHRRREVGKLLRGIILPAIIQQINNMTRELGHLEVGRSTGESCEVKDTNKNNLRHVVKIGSRECTCLEW